MKKDKPKSSGLTGIARRTFNTPLAIDDQKLEIILKRVIEPHMAARPVEAIAVDAERSDRKPYMVTQDGIAVIEVSGTLVHKASGMDAWSGLTSYEELRAEMGDVLADPKINGILLEFDSPGGEVSGLFDVADYLYSARGTKPVYGAVSDMACSAAYALASACDRVFLTRTACVGSIGVVAVHVDQSKMDAKNGLEYTFLHAGDLKVDGNSHEPLSDRARSTIQDEIDRVYGMFTASVARNRKLSQKAVAAQEAGVFFAEDGIRNGLADQIGTPDDAMNALVAKVSKARAAGMHAEAAGPVTVALSNGETMELDNAHDAGVAARAISAEFHAAREQSAHIRAPETDASAPNSPEGVPNMATPKTADAANLAADDEMKDKKDQADAKAAKEAKAAKPADDDPDGPDDEDPDDDEKQKESKAKAKEAKAKETAMAAATAPNQPVGVYVSAETILEIKGLCELAGQKDKAIDFIAENMTPKQVLSKLNELRAAKSAETPIFGAINPNRGAGIKAMQSEAQTYAREKGVTKEKAFATMLESNPQVYADYRRSHAAKAFQYQAGADISLGL